MNQQVTHLSLSTGNVAIFIVENQTTLPTFYNGITVSTGTQSNINVQRIFSSHLEKPYSDCTKDITSDYPSQLVKAVFSLAYDYGYGYTQQNCFLASFQRYLLTACNCFDTSVNFTLSFITERTDMKPCITFNDTQCETNVSF